MGWLHEGLLFMVVRRCMRAVSRLLIAIGLAAVARYVDLW